VFLGPRNDSEQGQQANVWGSPAVDRILDLPAIGCLPWHEPNSVRITLAGLEMGPDNPTPSRLLILRGSFAAPMEAPYCIPTLDTGLHR
jgi:hypothetical protein